MHWGLWSRRPRDTCRGDHRRRLPATPHTRGVVLHEYEPSTAATKHDECRYGINQYSMVADMTRGRSAKPVSGTATGRRPTDTGLQTAWCPLARHQSGGDDPGYGQGRMPEECLSLDETSADDTRGLLGSGHSRSAVLGARHSRPLPTLAPLVCLLAPARTTVLVSARLQTGRMTFWRILTG